MEGRISTALLSSVLFLVSVEGAFACGSPLFQLSLYWDTTTASQKTEFLQSLACSLHEAHEPEEFDAEMAKVLLDALDAGVPSSVVGERVQKFHCIHGARETESYLALRAKLGEDTFDQLCDAEAIKRMFVVVPESGAVLRSGPSVSANRLDAIAHGVLVTDAVNHDDWLHVRTHLGEGFIHSSLLRPY